MKRLTLFFVGTCLFSAVYSQTIIPLYTGKIPNSKPSDEHETLDSSCIRLIAQVQEPTIKVYLPSKPNATGQAMIICPGGGYQYLAYDWEGEDIAKLLNAHGIAGIVLKYRLPSPASSIYPYKTPLLDAQQAIRLTRENAAKWNIDPHKVGIIGFSAGGHLASTAGTHFDEETRPDFMALIYPVISMKEEITHMGSRNNLLGKNPSQELINLYSNELQVSDATPPTFLVHATDDGGVLVENSLRMYEALKNHHVSAEMHVYPYGGHGFALATGKGYLATWSDRLLDWLRYQNQEK